MGVPFHQFKVILLLIWQNFSCLKTFAFYSREKEPRVLLPRLTVNSEVLKGEGRKGEGSMGGIPRNNRYASHALGSLWRGEGV